MNRIICVRNGALDENAAGTQVHERLADTGLCDHVEVVGGALSELEAGDCLEQAERVVIVDTLEGFGRPGEVMVIENALEAEDRPEAKGLVDRLDYLSSLRELATEVNLPEILLVAVEPPFDDFDIEMVAEMSLGLAQERKGNA